MQTQNKKDTYLKSLGGSQTIARVSSVNKQRRGPEGRGTFALSRIRKWVRSHVVGRKRSARRVCTPPEKNDTDSVSGGRPALSRQRAALVLRSLPTNGTALALSPCRAAAATSTATTTRSFVGASAPHYINPIKVSGRELNPS